MRSRRTLSFLQCVQAPGLQDGTGQRRVGLDVAEAVHGVKIRPTMVGQPELMKCELCHKKYGSVISQMSQNFESDDGGYR